MNGLAVALFCSAGLLLFLATSATILRCIVRIRILSSFGLDDYLMVAAACSYIITEGFVFDAVQVTHDKDIVEVIAVLSRALKSMYFGEIFYVLTVWLLKLSIGTFLLRVVQKTFQRHIIQTVLFIVSLYSSAYLFMVVFQCTPIDHFWKPFSQGKCLPGHVNTNTSYAHAAVIGTSDLVFAILPVFVVWNLKMNLAMKVSVSGLLGLGGLAGITTFIRMPYIKALGESNALDFVAVTSRLAIWTCVEPGLGIFVGSLAALRPLFRKFLGASSIFSHSTPTPKSVNRYWPSKSSREGLNPLRSLSRQKNHCVITKVMGGIEGKKHGKFFGADSEENLNDNGARDGVLRTVEIKAVSEGSTTSTRATGTPTMNFDDTFAERGRFS